MNWYKFYPKDFLLGFVIGDAEELAFRRLIDAYYITEKPLSKSKVVIADITRMDEDVNDWVLTNYFIKTKSGWIIEAIQADIERRQHRTRINTLVGKRGGRPPKKE